MIHADLSKLMTREEYFKMMKEPAYIEAWNVYNQAKKDALKEVPAWDGKTYIYVRLEDHDFDPSTFLHALIKANEPQHGLAKLVWAMQVCREDIVVLKVATFEDVVEALRFTDDVTQFGTMD